MKLASYKGTQKGIKGLGNIAVRLRLRGPYSHSEIVFEPGDGVDHLMPDGTCEPDENGALWCLSSAATDTIPEWSTRRAGSKGGVRFKRIVLNSDKWHLVGVPHQFAERAAIVGVNYQGWMYDWQMIVGFVAWVIPHKRDRFTCSELCAMALGLSSAERFDPCDLFSVGKVLHCHCRNK